jgi:hypothetical protein
VTQQAIVRRETAISVAINVVLSIGFFVALFGLAGPAAPVALARDFVPQAFMVALMGTLVPGLLVRAKVGGAVGAVVLRALGFAIGAALIAGGLAFLLVSRLAAPVPVAPAIAIKAVFGGVLAAIVTPPAVRAVLRRGTVAREIGA